MMDEKGWLIISVEVQPRELQARLLVAAIAANRGYRVLIGQDRAIRRLARFLPKGLFFDKSLGSIGERKVARYHRLGFTFTAIDEESRGVYSDPGFFFSRRISADNLSLARRWFCLSDRIRNKAAEFFPEYRDRFVTTGLPRIDLCRPQFHSIHDSECAEIRSLHGRYILFCSNFGTILHARKGRFVENQRRKAAIQAPGNVAYHERVEREGRANLTSFLEVLPRFRGWFPDHKLLVRPHPSENVDFWKRAFSGLNGVEIVTGSSAYPWILSSDCLVHHGCTTGIEAELLGKPHVMYAPHPDVHHDTEIMKAFSTIVHDEKALRETVSAILSGENFSKPRKDLEEYYAALKGRLASERLVDEFDKLGSVGGDLPSNLQMHRFSPRHLIAEHFPRSAAARAYSKQKWPGVTHSEIRSSLETLAKGADIERQIFTEEVFPQLFHLQCS